MNRRKENANKGFSLVELIIVIAIMAVLIGVLAPQYLKYVERSRQSTDKQNVDAIVNALQIYYVDDQVTTQLTDGATVVLTTTDTAVAGGTGGNCTGNAELALTNAGITSIGLKSSSWGNVTLTVDITNGILSVDDGSSTILD